VVGRGEGDVEQPKMQVLGDIDAVERQNLDQLRRRDTDCPSLAHACALTPTPTLPLSSP